MLHRILPLFTDCRYRGPSFRFLELWGEGLSRMEMCLVFGNKALWSCAFHQASGSGMGLCGDSKCLWILAVSQTPAALRGWWGSSGQIQVCGVGLYHLPRIFCL